MYGCVPRQSLNGRRWQFRRSCSLERGHFPAIEPQIQLKGLNMEDITYSKLSVSSDAVLRFL